MNMMNQFTDRIQAVALRDSILKEQKLDPLELAERTRVSSMILFESQF